MRLLRITEEDVLEKTIGYIEDMPIVLANVQNVQAGLPKSMVLDPEWFDGNQTKFEDWWREIRLFLKSNRVTATDNRITVIFAHLREGIAGIYT